MVPCHNIGEIGSRVHPDKFDFVTLTQVPNAVYIIIEMVVGLRSGRECQSMHLSNTESIMGVSGKYSS